MTQSFLPPRLRFLAVLIGGALLGAGTMLPDVAGYATPLGAVALFLAGLGFKVPRWAVVRPVLTTAMVPTALAISEALQHPEKLPIPEELKAWAPLAAGLLSLLAGQVVPMRGTYPEPADGSLSTAYESEEQARAKVQEAVNRLRGLPVVLLCCALGAVAGGCAAGPGRKSISESLSAPDAQPVTALAPSENATQEKPEASPFSAGFALAVGLPLKGGEVVPAQLVVGSLKVAGISTGRGESRRERSVSLLAVGGVSGTAVSTAHAAWGFGLSMEATPGNLLYEVAPSAGVFWTSERSGPIGFLGVTISPKM